MGVYPRACGGTLKQQQPPIGSKGLSPRVRGNSDGWEPIPGWIGSIPARAGEPGEARRWVISSLTSVYPRACGGTSITALGNDRQQKVYPRACGGTTMISTGIQP